MAATIKDLARHLGVSTSAVSYALNGGKRRVSAELSAKVRAAATELGYHPNRVARAMVTRQSHTIGVVPHEMATNLFLSGYVQLVVNGMANEAARLNKDLLMFTRYGRMGQDELLSTLLDGRVDGVVFISPLFTLETIELASSLHLPCVTVSGGTAKGVASLRVDDEGGMLRIMQHLYDLGHRKIAHIAGRLDMHDALVRLRAYQAFVRRADLPYREDYVAIGNYRTADGGTAMRQLMALKDRPTAVTCANDDMAIGAVLATYDLGMKVPDDVSVTGFDMIRESEYVSPGITTVMHPIEKLGVEAIRTIEEILQGREVQKEKIFKSKLIIRASSSRI